MIIIITDDDKKRNPDNEYFEDKMKNIEQRQTDKENSKAQDKENPNAQDDDVDDDIYDEESGPTDEFNMEYGPE